MLALHLSNSAERPARTTLALILNLIYSSFFDPIYLCRQIICLENGDFCVSCFHEWNISGETFSFLSRPITKLIVADSWSLWLWVELADLKFGFKVQLKPVFELLNCAISLAMICEEGQELSFKAAFVCCVRWFSWSDSLNCKSSKSSEFVLHIY